jgi:H+/gluconate symporter-like permease
MAYQGFSVILFAPVAAPLAVVCTSPALVVPFYSGVFMEKMASFATLFPDVPAGLGFGKVIELSGFANSLDLGILWLVGPTRAVLSVRFAPS